jgi:hypothetical protein
VPKVEWNISLARPLSLIPLGQFREEVTILVVTNQLANIRRLSKSETLTVVIYGMVPCVTIKPLIHTVHIILRNKSGGTTWQQLKKISPLNEGGRYCTL